jgi:hypothetical protein
MALHHSPRIVTSGLVLALDAADKNSYPGSGTAWSDLSGNANNGTLTNGPTFNSANGGSIVFDGTNDYVAITPPSTSLINWYTGNYTIQCWFNGTTFTNSSNNGSSLCGNADPATSTEYWSFGPINTNKIKWYYYSGVINNIISNSTVSTNTWYNIAFTKISTTLTIYINGLLDISTTLSVIPQSSVSYPFIIGSVANGRFNGKVSSLCIYTQGLTSTEILQNYNATKTRFGL